MAVRRLGVFVRGRAVMLGLLSVLLRFGVTAMIMMVRRLAVVVGGGCMMRCGEVVLVA